MDEFMQNYNGFDGYAQGRQGSGIFLFHSAVTWVIIVVFPEDDVACQLLQGPGKFELFERESYE